MHTVQNYFSSLQATLDHIQSEPIYQAIDILRNARFRGKQIFIFGNGGSASTASHFACDLAKNTRREGYPPFRAISLTDNMALFSAFANDEGYTSVFSEPLRNLLQPGDVVIAISASGNSPNVLRAVDVARRMGATTIGLTGFNGGRLAPMVHVSLWVPSDCIEQVEDVHLMMEHLITKALRDEILLLPDSQVLADFLISIEHEYAEQATLPERMNNILSLTTDSLRATSGSLILLDQSGNLAQGALNYCGIPQEEWAEHLVDVLEQGLAGWVRSNRQPAIITSTHDDPRWLQREWEQTLSTPRSALSTPLMESGSVIGVLTVSKPGIRRFGPEDMALMTAMALTISKTYQS